MLGRLLPFVCQNVFLALLILMVVAEEMKKLFFLCYFPSRIPIAQLLLLPSSLSPFSPV